MPPADPASVRPVLTMRGVSKSYGERKVLDGVDFEVAAGEVFGLLGPNGAGKIGRASCRERV